MMRFLPNLDIEEGGNATEEAERRERDLLIIFVGIVIIIMMMVIIFIMMMMMMMTQDGVTVVGDIESGANKVFCHLDSNFEHINGDYDYEEECNDL